MPIFCENEAKRLFLYHLAESFFHEEGKNLSVFAARENKTVTVKLGTDNLYQGSAVLDTETHLEEKRAENAALGLAFGRAAKHLTSYVPPYGTLIGVRPVKVPVFYLEKGFSEEKILALLERDFLVLPEKAKLLLDLAKKEREFKKSLHPKDGMLYVSIPFCPSRCSYCSFVSSASPKRLALLPDYLLLLEKELKETARMLKQAKINLLSVYMGGGTPGILTARQMEHLLSCIRNEFGAQFGEFCVEMGRPDTVSREKLDVLAHFGVNRISINSQTTNNETLFRIGRKHSAEDYFAAMESAKKYPFIINCDLISALPGERPADFLKSVRETLRCEPDNLTIHALCQKKSAAETSVSEESFAEAVKEAHGLCINSGLEPYYLYRQKKSADDLENLGFASKGNFSPYNLAMMEDLCHIFACGAGGIGKIIPWEAGQKIVRFPNFKYPFEYLSEPEKIALRLNKIENILIGDA